MHPDVGWSVFANCAKQIKHHKTKTKTIRTNVFVSDFVLVGCALDKDHETSFPLVRASLRGKSSQ